MADTANNEHTKIAALQNIVNAQYVPEFVKTCAELGLQFENETDLAHALQLNGKFASLVSSGVSIDTLVDSIVTNLNVKHASEGQIKLSLASMNYALDASLDAAGIPSGEMNKAASADSISAVSDDELLNFLNVVS
jgi:hypothetical protein